MAEALKKVRVAKILVMRYLFFSSVTCTIAINVKASTLYFF